MSMLSPGAKNSRGVAKPKRYRHDGNGLQFEQVTRDCWRFVSPEDGRSHVGPQYPTKRALLADNYTY